MADTPIIPRGINSIYIQDLSILSELPNDAVLLVINNGKPYKITGGQLKQLLIIEGDSVYAPLVDGKVPIDFLPSSNADINDVLGAGNIALDKEIKFTHSYTSAFSVFDENGIVFTFEASESMVTAVQSSLKNLSLQNTVLKDVARGIEDTDGVNVLQLNSKADKSTTLQIGETIYDLSQNRVFPLPIGSGGYEANVYLTNIDSSNSGYKKMAYTPELTETIKSIVATNNTVLGEKYLYDSQIGITNIPSGEWKFKLYGRISSTSGGTSTVTIRVFRYLENGTEVDLVFGSKVISNTTNDTIQFTSTQAANVICNSTDRLGVQISLTTTRNSATTFYYSLGDGNAAYINSPLPFRHELLRNLEWLASGHKGTASKLAGFDSFGNAAEIDKLPATAITINPTVLNNLSVLDVILSQLVDKFDLGQFKKTTYQTEFDNGNSGVAKPIDWNNGQNQRITLTANCVLTLPSVTGTGRFQIKFIQDMFGGWSVTFAGQTVKNPSNFDFANGQPYQECIATFYWDGGKYIMLSTPYYI